MVAAGWYADPWGQAPLRWWDGARWTHWTSDTQPPHTKTSPADEFDQQRERWNGSFASLLGNADRLAVIDIETTGLYSTDRVVEIAVVTLDRNGLVLDEFETLTNPLRDPGPTWLHGLTPSVLRGAPLFEDIAQHVAALLHGAVVAAHNLPFDRRLLGYEFDRAGIEVDWGHGIDTLSAVGGCKLDTACADYGINLSGAHRALHDARATAQLLLRVADAFENCRPAAAYPVSGEVPRTLTRDGFTSSEIERPYLVRLADSLHSPPDIAPYLNLLDYAMADLRFENHERRELEQLARDLGLSETTRTRAHRNFLEGLIHAAVKDGVVTDEEFDQLCRVAALLELDDAIVCARTNPFRAVADSIELHSGLRVCFTGSAQWPNGETVERRDLEALARRHNLEPVTSVTKTGCDLLVAADPASMSRKARDAHRFGIPIASVADFLNAIDNCSPLSVIRVPPKGVGLVCTICGQSWIADRRTRNPICASCRQAAKPLAGPNDGRNAANTAVRAERLERCRQAVKLQRDGASRREIAASLGVSQESVKALLRDGKFYDEPETDPARLESAKRAAQARARGVTRTEFALQARLSKAKADECWKDADVLFGGSGSGAAANEGNAW